MVLEMGNFISREWGRFTGNSESDKQRRKNQKEHNAQVYQQNSAASAQSIADAGLSGDLLDGQGRLDPMKADAAMTRENMNIYMQKLRPYGDMVNAYMVDPARRRQLYQEGVAAAGESATDAAAIARGKIMDVGQSSINVSQRQTQGMLQKLRGQEMVSKAEAQTNTLRGLRSMECQMIGI